MKLRDYQVEMLESFVGAPHMSLAVAPPGSGKTIVMTELAKKLDAWIICPTVKLVDQTKKHYDKVCTYNTAYLRGLSGDYLIIDEAHRVKLDGMVDSVIGNFKTAYGLTATPNRSDVGDIYPEIFTNLVMEVTKDFIIDKGNLTPRTYVDIPVANLVNVKAAYLNNIRDLSDAVCPQTSKCLDDFINRYNGGKTIIFGCDVMHCTKIKNYFDNAGLVAHYVDGSMPKKDSDAILDAFHRDEFNFLINCQLLTTGYDEPAIENVVLLRPISSASLYEQICGRGDRIFPGKTHNYIYDYTYSKFNVQGKPSKPGVKFCLECGAINNSSRERCIECKAKLFKYESNLKQCYKCNADNFARSKYCCECGVFIGRTYRLTEEHTQVGVMTCGKGCEVLVDGDVIGTMSPSKAYEFVSAMDGTVIKSNNYYTIYEVKPFKMLMNKKKLEKIIPVDKLGKPEPVIQD